MTEITSDELKTLSVGQRLRLMEAVWESLREKPEAIEVPEWHRVELDQRLEGLASEAGQGRSWSEVRERILGSM